MAEKSNAVATVEITYFSDILCIWAYAAEIRLSELRKKFAGKINVVERFSPVFADTFVKIGEGWADRGGFEGFSKSSQDTAKKLGFIKVNKKVWTSTRPTTSTQAHLLVMALQNCNLKAEASKFACILRSAFFEDAQDISNMDVLYSLAEGCDLPVADIKKQVETGQAMASLMADYKAHYDLHVKGSPTYIMNNGRQVLFGNVGYRILEANVHELLALPNDEIASWC